MSKMTSKDPSYTWHLSLRADRPVEGCAVRPHAYLYSKKIDERDETTTNTGNSGSNSRSLQHSKKSRDPIPNHEFSFRWFRGPRQESCAYEDCPRRTSFSPHDWSKHALGGGYSLQCISTQSSLYKATFCNSNCFVQAWKTQYTVPKYGDFGNARGGSSVGGSVVDDDARSIGSVGSYASSNGESTNGRRKMGKNCKNQYNYQQSNADDSSYPGSSSVAPASAPGTPKGLHNYPSFNDFGASAFDTEYAFQQAEEWVEITRDQIYIPIAEDVGRKLKLECAAYSTDTGELLMHRVVKTDLVLSRAPDPEKRNLVTVKGGSGSGGGGARFRMVTYNLLAEIYATQQQYPYCDFWALSWDYRFQNILREIIDVCPDVICMQEVQADHYESHIYNALSDIGFEGVYKQKTRQSMGLAGKVDGCALFWRRTKFHLVESYSIEFNELAQRQATQVLGMNPRSEECVSYLNRLSKDNIAQLVVLELAQPTLATRTNRDPINQLCIANTHLYSNKDFPDVKLWQTWQLLQELETFVVSRGSNLPLMICGDFNSTPDTAVYDLLSRQAVHPGHPDVNMNVGEDGSSATNILPDPMSITHSFQLGSVYNTVMGEEPRATNYTVNFKGVLDYLWYSAQNLRPLSAAPIPDEEELTKHGEALPSTQYSSDHVMLISDMQIVSGGSRPP